MILGNPKVLAKHPLWHVLLTHFKERDCLAEGPLTSLRPSTLQLPPRTRAFDGRSFALGTPGTTRYDDEDEDAAMLGACGPTRNALLLLLFATHSCACVDRGLLFGCCGVLTTKGQHSTPNSPSRLVTTGMCRYRQL